MRRALGLALVLALAMTAPVRAQDRPPAQRQTLIDLAFALGQSHALRQLCLGQTDQFWRERMNGLLQAETPDEAFDRSLRESFNTGYADASARHPACDADSKADAAVIARHGATLATAAGRP